jgi:tRNA pseudouridine55 synthase
MTAEPPKQDDALRALANSPAPLPDPPPQAGEAEQAPRKQKRGPQPRREKRDVDGWLLFDKPVGMTSTHAVAVAKRIFKARKAGHAGTLDPLASGVLPIAMGEATKTVPFVMEGRKAYRFTVRWGAETDTDDAEGRVTGESPIRPSEVAILAELPNFTGTIMQVPPRFSAIKIQGERAYDLAREGEAVELAPRNVEIHRLSLVAMPDADHAVFEAECGKGTYVRAIARDMGRALGTLGHVSALRRTAVGPFAESDTVTLAALEEAAEAAGAGAHLRRVDAGLRELPALSVSRSDAARLAQGQPVLLRGRDAPVMEGWVAVSTQGSLIALAEIERGELHPRRIFQVRGAQ